MIIFTHEQILAANDDVFLEAHGIPPYLLEELTGPAVPAEPQAITEQVRRPGDTDGCFWDMCVVVVLVAGCLTFSGFAIAGLMQFCEWVITRCR